MRFKIPIGLISNVQTDTDLEHQLFRHIAIKGCSGLLALVAQYALYMVPNQRYALGLLAPIHLDL